MKFTCLQENLAKGVNIVHRVVPTSSSLDILKNILIKTEENGIKLVGTDQTTTVTTFIHASIDTPGEITIPAKKLKEIIENMSARTIDAEVKKDTLHLSSENAKTKLNGIGAKDYPELPDLEINGNAIEIDTKALAHALSSVAYAAGGADSQPVFTGIYLNYSDGKLTIVGCDGFRLAEKVITAEGSSDTKQMTAIIPARTLAELIKMFNGNTLKIALNTTENSLVIADDTTKATTVIINGQYPNYKAIIPASSTTTAEVNVNQLLEAISLANIFNNDDNKTIKLKINNEGSIGVTAKSSEDGAHESTIPAQITGENLELAFKSRFLLDYLNMHKGSNIVMHASTSTAPIKLVNNDHPNYIHVVMPLQIN